MSLICNKRSRAYPTKMVSISKLLNNGLLLATQAIYTDLATPEQAAVEQYNILHFLGGSAPYVQNPGFGISTEIPEQCTLEQVQLYSRHGERYPSKGNGKTFEAIYNKLKAYNGTLKGDLSFVNDYTYFVPDPYWYEKETTPSNSEGYFSGTSNALKHGAAFRAKYNALYSQNATLPVFSSNSGRCYQTSNFFARGFLGDNYTENAVQYVIIDEDPDMGLNSLTPRAACNAYNSSSGAAKVANYSTQYLKDIQARLVKQNPGLNLTTSDIQNLFGYAAFEINVRGYSPFADLFTNDEFIKYSYSQDLANYYNNGPGNNLTKAIGSTFLNSSLALLKNTTAENKVWLSFSHDTDWEIFNVAIGLIEPAHELPTDQIPFPNPYVHSQLVPQGARIYTEKYHCGNDSYVRYILNDAVIPLKNCSSGPGFSCKLSDFETYVENRLHDVNVVEQCQVFNNVSHELTFYWDYPTKNYSVPLIDS